MSQVGNHRLGSLALMTALDSQLDKIVVVTTGQDELNWVSPRLFQSYRNKWFQAACVKSNQGQSYSLKCGLQYAESLHAEAVLIMLADQPFISKDMIHRIIGEYSEHLKPISFIAASCSGVFCPPIFFSKNMFEDLYKLQGDKGARYLIRNRMEEGTFIEFADRMRFFDVDTKDDYITLLQKIKL